MRMKHSLPYWLTLTALWLLPMALQAQDRSQTIVNEQFMGLTLYNIFDELALKYGLEFDYHEEDIPNTLLSAQFFRNKSIQEVLQSLLASYDVAFVVQASGNVVIRKKGVELVKTYTASVFDFTLRGKIIDKVSGETLPFATVYCPGSGKGATTNVDGHFSLLNTPTDTSTLVLQYLGYKSKQIKLNPDMLSNNEVVLTMKAMTTQLAEVVISDQKEHMVKASGGISTISVSPAQLSTLPSLGEKDIFRSLQLLPGISGTNETSSGLFVRGGTPDQNLVLFDGFTVYHVDHFYGFFSAFNANAVKDVQFYKGGYDARFGGRLSSVVSLTGKNGNNNKASGNIGISALSVNGSLELPFANSKGSLFLAGRRSYTDIIQSGLFQNIFDIFDNENEGNGLGGRGGPGGGPAFGQTETEPTFHFYDLNAKLTFRPSNRDILSLSFYNGQDKLDNSNSFNSNQFGGFGGFGGGDLAFDNSTTDINDWGNVGSSLKWSRQWNERFFTNAVASYSRYFTDRDRFTNTDITRADSSFTVITGVLEDNTVDDYSFRLDNEFLLNDRHKVEFGAQYTFNRVDYFQLQNDTVTVLDRQDEGTTLAAYVQDTWQPMPRLSITPGIRVAYYSGTEETYIEPRVAATYQINDRLKAKAAWGQYNQFVTRVVREDLSQGSRDFWLLANNDLNPVSSATHYIAGLSYETDAFLFDVEAYYKDMAGLSEYTLRFANNLNAREIEVSELFYEGTGYARGIELLLQKKFGEYTGWIGYTLSEVTHEFDGLSDEPYPALHDQTHEFKLVNSVRLGKWTLAGTWVYATGKPYTRPVGFNEVTLLDGSTTSYVSVGEKNAYRLPAYHRMDVSATYGWDWGRNAKAELGLSVFNLYNNTNVWYKTFDIIEGTVVETDVNTIGFTPNLFFNIKF